MHRHTVKYEGLPGVEFCEDDSTLYIDLPAHAASLAAMTSGDLEDALIFQIVGHWRMSMPAYLPRAYAIRGLAT